MEDTTNNVRGSWLMDENRSSILFTGENIYSDRFDFRYGILDERWVSSLTTEQQQELSQQRGWRKVTQRGYAIVRGLLYAALKNHYNCENILDLEVENHLTRKVNLLGKKAENAIIVRNSRRQVLFFNGEFAELKKNNKVLYKDIEDSVAGFGLEHNTQTIFPEPHQCLLVKKLQEGLQLAVFYIENNYPIMPKWKADWSNPLQSKYCIVRDYEGNLVVKFSRSMEELFSFPTQQIAESFLKYYQSELEEIKPLL